MRETARVVTDTCEHGASWERWPDRSKNTSRGSDRMIYRCLDFPDDWPPTVANVNALPAPLRDYIMELETRCDPAGDVKRMSGLVDENAALRGALDELRGELRRLAGPA